MRIQGVTFASTPTGGEIHASMSIADRVFMSSWAIEADDAELKPALDRLLQKVGSTFVSRLQNAFDQYQTPQSQYEAPQPQYQGATPQHEAQRPHYEPPAVASAFPPYEPAGSELAPAGYEQPTNGAVHGPVFEDLRNM